MYLTYSTTPCKLPSPFSGPNTERGSCSCSNGSKDSPASKWQPGQWEKRWQSPTVPTLQPPPWVQNAGLRGKRETWWRSSSVIRGQRTERKWLSLSTTVLVLSGKCPSSLAHFRGGQYHLSNTCTPEWSVILTWDKTLFPKMLQGSPFGQFE